MAQGIASAFVRKLYRILDVEDNQIISWGSSGTSFIIHDSIRLNADILPRYFRGRLVAFRQQLIDHGFKRMEDGDDKDAEIYYHVDFIQGEPGRLARIVRAPTSKKPSRSKSLPETKQDSSDRFQQAVTSDSNPGSLRVKIMTKKAHGNDTSCRKRPAPDDSEQEQRFRPVPMCKSDQSEVENAPPAPPNPLFTDGPDADDPLSITHFLKGRQLPTSTELPDPISYLSSNDGRQDMDATTSYVADPPSVSENVFRSALHRLISDAGEEQKAAPAQVLNEDKEASASQVLASLLASSTSYSRQEPKMNATKGVNPLFSDAKADDGQDSLWHLLVESSVGRVKESISKLKTPQERLEVVKEERERLEKHRNQLEQSRQGGTQESDVTIPDAAYGQADDDQLWRLLMTSSVDMFRRATNPDRPT